MIDIQNLNNRRMVSVNTVVSLLGVKPYVVQQKIQGLVSRRLIEAPYEYQSRKYLVQDSYIELANVFKIAVPVHEQIMDAFSNDDIR